MAPKHNWSSVGATSKERVAELMGGAVTNGRQTFMPNHIEYVWTYQGRTIVVRSSLEGHISNGWVV